jgi:hypothetical protein
MDKKNLNELYSKFLELKQSGILIETLCSPSAETFELHSERIPRKLDGA